MLKAATALVTETKDIRRPPRANATSAIMTMRQSRSRQASQAVTIDSPASASQMSERNDRTAGVVSCQDDARCPAECDINEPHRVINHVDTTIKMILRPAMFALYYGDVLFFAPMKE